MEAVVDLIIIGGGPAGLAAAIYGARANLKTILIEKSVPGGKLLNTHKIDNYPGFKELSGTDLAIKFIDHAESLGIKIEGDEVSKIENIEDEIKTVILKSNKKYQTKSIILAMGMNPKKLPIKEYQTYFGHGLSTCIVCDGVFYRNKDIAVIGGGTSASEESLFASKIVRNIYIINLFDKLDVVDSVKEKIIQAKNIHIKYNYELIKINGDGKDISSITIKNRKTNEIENINVSGVFSYIGWIPATKFLQDSKILNKDNFVTIDFKTGKTKIRGVFAAGDIVTKDFHQVSGAISDGTNAALSAKKYLDSL
ncbi:MAG: thioredoxin reductase [Candidatus Hepatoplasma scabrum]|nr:MAG: thioredoxin reductase [Candidatus Hepatoplasma sp.]